MEQILLYLMLLIFTTCNSKLLLNCEKVLPMLAELESSILTQLGGPSPVIEDGIQYICLARGTTQGMYRAASGTVAYHNHHKGHNGGHRGHPHKVGHFHVHCYNGEWLIDGSEPSHHHPHNNHCRKCNELYNITNCNECSPRCKKCVSNEDMCCSYYRNGSCSTQCLMSSSISQCQKSTVVPKAITPSPTSVEYCSQCTDKKSSCCQSCSAHTLNGHSSVKIVNTTLTNVNIPHPQPTSCNMPNCAVCDDDDCCTMCSDGYVLDTDNCDCIASKTRPFETSASPATSTSTMSPATTNIDPKPSLPPSRNDDNNKGIVPGILTGIIFAVVLGMLILLTTVALATYLVYYLLQRYTSTRTRYATTHTQGPGLQFHENPLYLRPEEVTGDTTRLL